MWLNWVTFRPGIWDGGATSSTESCTWDRSPTQRCLGLAPIRWSKQWGIDILPIFLLELWSNLQMCMASFASQVIWEGSLLIILKLDIEGKGWWKSIQCKVLHYNNYPRCLIDKWGKSDKSGPLIHSDTGHEIKKQFFVSVPYFPGLSESYKKIFKYTTIQVCFKGVNTLKLMLMHPEDKIPIDLKKDIVYHWECQVDRCKSFYIGETSRALGERESRNIANPQPQPYSNTVLTFTIPYFNIINKDPSQITWEAKETIHIWRLDHNSNRNIGKMSIPHCFDHLIGAKPKHLWMGLLSKVQDSVDEVAPSSQIPGLNVTQFNHIGTFRPNIILNIAKYSTRACRAKNLLN